VGIVNRAGFAGALLGCLLAAGCSSTAQVGTPGGRPDCAPAGGGVSGGVVLIAQSVPTAQWLPCLRRLPPGWTYEVLDARNGSARVVLDSDRDGPRAATVTLTGGCDTAAATEVPSSEPAARRYDRVWRTNPGYGADWHYLLTGGCITYHFDLHGSTGAEPAADVATAFGFVQRSTVAAAVSDRSDGRLSLDPSAGDQ
jgi:hypothetical protein